MDGLISDRRLAPPPSRPPPPPYRGRVSGDELKGEEEGDKEEKEGRECGREEGRRRGERWSHMDRQRASCSWAAASCSSVWK